MRGTYARERQRFPTAVDPTRVGRYPAVVYAGGGFVWDDVVEYRVWCHPPDGTGDVYYAFASYPKALAFSRRVRGAEEPLALVRQREYIDEPSRGRFVHVRKRRITEWPVEFLDRPRRNKLTIPRFFALATRTARLDFVRGRVGRRR